MIGVDFKNIFDGFLRRCLPTEDRDPILGDLEETLLIRYPEGGPRAHLWYSREVLALSIRFLLQRAWEWRRSRRSRCAFPSGRRRKGGYEVETIWIELWQAARSLRRDWSFSAVVVLTLMLGIGSTTAVYSVLSGVLLHPLPFREPQGLVFVWENDRATGTEREASSVPDYFDFIEQNRVFEGLVAYQVGSANFSVSGQDPRRLGLARVTPGWDEVLGPPLVLGRGFDSSTGSRSEARSVVLSESLWRQSFEGRQDVLGETLTLDGEIFTVIGVVASEFRFPAADTAVWIGMPLTPTTTPRSNHSIQVIARLRPEVTLEMAQDDMTAIATRLEAQYSENANRGVFTEPLADYLRGSIRPSLLVLAGAVALVLLIACANVANLLLARSTRRRREIALHAALGATPRRMAGKFLAESALIVFFAWLTGLMAAYSGLRLILVSAPAELQAFGEVAMDRQALWFACLVSAGIALVFGLAPMLRSRRLDLSASLNEGGRSAAVESPAGLRIQRALVVSQMALAMVLVVGASLLLNSFVRLQSVDPGFDSRHLLRADFQLPENRYPRNFANYPNWPELQLFHDLLLADLRTKPGISSAALTSNHPLDAGFTNSFVIEGREAEYASQGEMTNRLVSDDYFETAAVSLLRGRLLPRHTGSEMGNALVLNRAAAERYFPQSDPIGQRIRFWGRQREIVGIVDNERMHGLGEATPPAMYVSMHQNPGFGAVTILIRTDRDPSLFVGVLRDAVRKLDPEVALYGVATMESTVRESLARERFTATLLGSFAVVAGLLAILGVYSVLSYLVTQRSHEVGVRVAMGAGRGHILVLVLRQGMGLAAIGIALGVAGSLALSRFLSHFLYGVGPLHPQTYLAATGILALAALVASWVPARRACRLDPVSAIRS